MRKNPNDHCWGDYCGPGHGFADSCNCNCYDCRKADGLVTSLHALPRRPKHQPGFRVLICGSRDWGDEAPIRAKLGKMPKGTIVIEGGADGADTIARKEALSFGFDVETYWANWKRHGKGAGFIRNRKMLDQGNPHLVIGFPLPRSRGTWNMIELARKAGIRVETFPFRKPKGHDGPPSMTATDYAGELPLPFPAWMFSPGAPGDVLVAEHVYLNRRTRFEVEALEEHRIEHGFSSVIGLIEVALGDTGGSEL